MKKPRTTEADALAALFAAYKRHGHETFKLPRGNERAALLLAIEKQWIYGWNDHVRITQAGVAALAPWLENAG